FVAQEKRSKRDLRPGFSLPSPTHRKVPRDIGTCHLDARREFGKNLCGRAVRFGNIDLELVVVSANEDKCPSVQCQLYDAEAKKFSPVPGVPGADVGDVFTCGPFLFEDTGKSYLFRDNVCGADAPCTSVGRQAIDWLDGSYGL